MCFQRMMAICVSLLFVVGCETVTSRELQQQAPELPERVASSTEIMIDKPIESMEAIFALPDSAKQNFRTTLQPAASAHAKTTALLQFIFNSEHLPLQYVNSATLVASDTLMRRQANCLSLSILAFALAQEAGFTVEFQEVQIPEFWVTERGNSRLNGHVNLVLFPSPISYENGAVTYSDTRLIVDFDADYRTKSWPTKVIDKATIVGMFYNNKAADLLAGARYQEAYVYLKAAAELAPGSAQTWSNLAVLFRQVGLNYKAEESYLYSLKLDPYNTNTMANLALLYRLQGREQKALPLEAYVERQRKSNPYYFVMLGEEALSERDSKIAKASFKQALALNPQLYNAMFGMAKAYLLEGNHAQALQYLQNAQQNSRLPYKRSTYDAKLKMLQQVAVLH